MHLPAPDALLAALVSAGTTASLASGAPPDTNPLSWVPFLLSVVGPTLALVINRLLAAHAAKKRALAQHEDAEAVKAEADKDPATDPAAHRLKAAELRAEADALEALKPSQK
jgi:hypothetical protein